MDLKNVYELVEGKTYMFEVAGEFFKAKYKGAASTHGYLRFLPKGEIEVKEFHYKDIKDIVGIKTPKKTAREIEVLKENWYADPIWDLYETEGFEAHREELKKFQEESEAGWQAEIKRQDEEIDRQAEALGVAGLYRLIMKHEELLKRHERAIELLGENESHNAYRVLQGYEE